MLLRVYTQNIDGLELKSGLSTHSGYGIDNTPMYIPLHGTLEQLHCHLCHSTFLLEAYLSTLGAGHLPACSTCDNIKKARAKSNLRNRKTASFLMPDIVLYGEPHCLGEEIAEVQKKDIRSVDLLLVVGTGMKVPGTADAIRVFSKAVTQRNSKKRSASMGSMFLNIDLPQKQWSDLFDLCIHGDCQTFATMVQQALGKKKPNGTKGSIYQVDAVTMPKSGTEEECSVSRHDIEMADS